ncbi:Similar to Septin-7; acc. no. Q6GLZ5 [Pyronema omphalodes CBS 100304]|uniref:Similar to Septin-7 acc. no. Q6GLZ5 n=1 Tax=Pyronema omphalodes (strain CBS 100304) TaxID=1076935 RepID=U4LCX9_PYROM|nr:Similar to Septin-7; acc. no. Q6GLZ5 [Pyronema omphalodes CBS 100304]
MRPTTATTADALLQGVQRPRKHSDSHAPSVANEDRDRDSSPQILYFLADEATMAAASGGISTTSSSFHTGAAVTPASTAASVKSNCSGSTNYGVRSLEASVTEAELRGRGSPVGREEKKEDGAEEDEDDGEYDDDIDNHSMTSLNTTTKDFMSEAPSPKTNMSLPLTPVLGPSMLPSPAMSPRTPRSTRGKDIEDCQQFMGDAPQLIMPQIIMPSRRPFTDKGKRIGKLKILIAGDSGIGKTSLIKSIVQTCEDIVHVDPVTTNSSSSRHSRRDSDSTKKITEVYASTRPYPHWWGEIDDNKVLRRRKSRGLVEEQVIERNLTFVDTPGYGSGTSFLECIEPIVKYVESQFDRTNNILNNGDRDLMSMISGSGTPQVDIVLYVILHRLKPVDIEFMRRLSPYTTILPIIAKSDTLTPPQIRTLKLQILSDLRSANIRPFLFGKTPAELLRTFSDNNTDLDGPTAPFAISSLVSSDSDNMDASVLMSPDYIPPLVDTELSLLVEHLFNPDNVAWLKHLAAKKYMECRSSLAIGTSLIASARLGAPGAQNVLSPPPIAGPSSPRRPASPVSPGRAGHATDLIPLRPDSYTMSKITDHCQREEFKAKVRLSRWANDLQKSLQAEKERYERLARGERAVWLTERLGETVMDGQLVPIRRRGQNSAGGSSQAVMGIGGGMAEGIAETGPREGDMRDPFGLLRIKETVGNQVLVLIKIAGVGGLVGVVGVWMYKWSAGAEGAVGI